MGSVLVSMLSAQPLAAKPVACDPLAGSEPLGRCVAEVILGDHVLRVQPGGFDQRRVHRQRLRGGHAREVEPERLAVGGRVEPGVVEQLEVILLDVRRRVTRERATAIRAALGDGASGSPAPCGPGELEAPVASEPGRSSGTSGRSDRSGPCGQLRRASSLGGLTRIVQANLGYVRSDRQALPRRKYSTCCGYFGSVHASSVVRGGGPMRSPALSPR